MTGLVRSIRDAPLAAARGASATDWLAALNAEQRQAVTHGGARPAQPLLVIAGAGTGKTATLAHRVAWLVSEGAAPERILLLTFSRRAAVEMTRRAQRLLAARSRAAPGAGPSMTTARLDWAGTFHAVGARLLREHASAVGLDPGFGILDRGDAADLMDLVRQQAGLDRRSTRFPRKDTCLAIYSYCVNAGRPLTEVLALGWPWAQEHADDLAGLFRDYVARKLADVVLDFDDLLLWWHQAMQEPPFAAAIGARFDHVLVDEYQDTNRLQAGIVEAMKPDGRGVMVVGDDAQSIYAFRAAEVDNILAFGRDFARLDRIDGVRQVTLKTNYRSVQPVLDVAEALIAQGKRQFPKALVAHRGAGARPRLVTVRDDRAQADHVIDEILRQREAGVALRRQAVLFRSSHHSDLLEVELARRKIPFVKYGGLKFLEAAHVKDVLAVLRWIDNPKHQVAAFRAVQLLPGIGPGLARRCLDALAGAGHRWRGLDHFAAPAAAAAAWHELRELITALAEPSAPWAGQLERVCTWYRPLLEARHDDAALRAADLETLAVIAAQFPNRERFLTETTLDPPSATGDLAGDPLRDEDYLVLSTVHSAKGQEWDAVHVLNVADGNFPNEFATGTAAGIDEERRLLYVAITRARDTLQLVEPQRYYVTQQSRLGDRHVHGARSRFLTRAVLERLDRVAGGEAINGSGGAPEGAGTAGAAGERGKSPVPVVDVAGRIGRMWAATRKP
jgi:DNA helicase-2/ATP-dependent DNA helicase PcrA